MMRREKMDDLILTSKNLQEKVDALATVKPKPLTKEQEKKAATQEILAENFILEKQISFLRSRSMAKEAKDAKTSKALGEGNLLPPKTEVVDHQKTNVEQAYRSIPSPTMPQDRVTPFNKKHMPRKKPSQKIDEVFEKQKDNNC
jgi:hypothetical protein